MQCFASFLYHKSILGSHCVPYIDKGALGSSLIWRSLINCNASIMAILLLSDPSSFFVVKEKKMQYQLWLSCIISIVIFIKKKKYIIKNPWSKIGYMEILVLFFQRPKVMWCLFLLQLTMAFKSFNHGLPNNKEKEFFYICIQMAWYFKVFFSLSIQVL